MAVTVRVVTVVSVAVTVWAVTVTVTVTAVRGHPLRRQIRRFRGRRRRCLQLVVVGG